VAAPLISLRGASVAHREGLPPVLHDVSLEVHRGDWTAVVGENGSGKTTLLAALGGVLAPCAGSIDRAHPLRVALLLQEPDNQLVASSVAHELALSVPLDVAADARRARIADAVDRFELGLLLGRNPHQLSGGEKQRLALATVWLESPDVLLLDEPLSFLDDEMRERILAFVREMNAAGVAVVWATPGDDAKFARHVIVLKQGRTSGHDEAARIDADFEHAAVHITEMAPEPASIPVICNAEAQPRVRFEAVSFGYDQKPVLQRLDFSALPSESIAVTGRNGSGKSTLLLLAGGALAPSSGRIERRVREHGVLYLPQSPERLFFAESVMEEILFGLLRRGVASETARHRAEAALDQAGLEAGVFATRSPFELSFGEMRRVAFAIAYALEPDLLLLDEPASGLDARGIVALGRLLDSTARRGATVLVASHERGALTRHHRVLELREGALHATARARAGGD